MLQTIFEVRTQQRTNDRRSAPSIILAQLGKWILRSSNSATTLGPVEIPIDEAGTMDDNGQQPVENLVFKPRAYGRNRQWCAGLDDMAMKASQDARITSVLGRPCRR